MYSRLQKQRGLLKKKENTCAMPVSITIGYVFDLFFVFLLKMTELANAANPPSLISCCLIHNYTTVSSDWFWLDKRHSRVLIWSLKARGPVTLCITDDDDMNGSRSQVAVDAAKLNQFQLLTEVSNMESKKKKTNKEEVSSNCHQLRQQVLQLDHRGSHLKWMENTVFFLHCWI